MQKGQKRSVGEQLKKFRQSLGKKQNVFSEELGITQSHLSYIERGGKNITENIIISLVSKYPDLNLNWLFTGRGNMTYLPNKLPSNLEKAYLEKVEEISELKSEIISLLKHKNQTPIFVD